MADILEFPVKSPSPAARAQRAHRRNAAAEVVIFPGIRYEHWDEATSSSSKPAPERDLLRLVE